MASGRLTDEAIQRQRLGENEDKDHAHKQLGLLRVGPHAGVTHNADGHAGTQARKAARLWERRTEGVQALSS